MIFTVVSTVVKFRMPSASRDIPSSTISVRTRSAVRKTSRIPTTTARIAMDRTSHHCLMPKLLASMAIWIFKRPSVKNAIPIATQMVSITLFGSRITIMPSAIIKMPKARSY